MRASVIFLQSVINRFMDVFVLSSMFLEITNAMKLINKCSLIGSSLK